jgi:hypothetical protein
VIKATCYSDDHIVECSFDATPWFVQATEDAVRALDECGWGGDYPADAVALFIASHDDGVKRMFTYLDIMDGHRDVGFECYVDEHDAVAWLRAAEHKKGE